MMKYQKTHPIGTLLQIMLNALFPLILFSCGLINNPNPPCRDKGLVPTDSYWEPAWYPTGEFIGFNHLPLVSITYPDGDNCSGVQHFDVDSLGFWIIRPDGSHMHRIYDQWLQTPQWSPDGQWIAFVKGAQIYKMRFTGNGFDTTSITQLTFTGRNFFPSWSPSGDRIAYDSDVDSDTGLKFIWIMNSDGTSKHRISYEPDQGEHRQPSWSPNGDKIVHVRFIGIGSSEIFTMDTTGDIVLRLTNNEVDEKYPEYSPDGSYITFVSDNKLCHITTSGSEFQQLNEDRIQSYSWNPNGTKLVYTKYEPHDWSYSNSTLWLLNYPDGFVEQLTYNP